MKVYTCVKNNGNKKIKIFGLTIYKKTKKQNIIKRKYLGGLFKILEETDKKKYYILGVRFFKTINYQVRILRGVHREIEVLRQNLFTSAHHSSLFPRFKSIHKGQDIVIVASGPTLNFYTPIEGAISIGMNHSFASGLHFDYYFLSHYSEASKAYIDDVRQLNCMKFFGRYLDPDIREWNVPENVFEDKNTFKYYIANDFSLPFFEVDINNYPIKNGGSIAFHALQFALWTHPKRIYLVGCDCTMAGYFLTGEKQPVWLGLKNTMENYPKLKTFAEIFYPDTEIISINPVGLKGLFKDVYTKSYVQANMDIFKDDMNNIQYL